MSLLSLSLIFGHMVAVGAQSLETTSLAACINGSISLPGNDPSRLVEYSWWKARYRDGSWIEIGHCVKTKGCTNATTVLPGGTRVWIGINESLTVERTSDQRNAPAQYQFLVEDNLQRRHIFTVNFTVYCIWTKQSGNLNLSQIVLGLYTRKHLVELYLFDTNGTQFAHIHRDKGASLKMTNSHPATSYCHRLTIKQGSLMFLKINKADNGKTIVVQALLLNSKQTSTSLGSLSTKTIQIFVFNSIEPTGRSPASTSLYQKHSDLDYPPSSSSTTRLNGQSAKTSSDLAWYEQLWAIIFIPIMATTIIIIIVIFIILLVKKMKHRSSVSLPSDVP